MISIQPVTTLFEVPVFTGSKEKALQVIQDHIENGDSLLRICTPNPEQFVLSWKDNSFLSMLQSADLNLPDGAGVVWALQKKLKARSDKQKIENKELRTTNYELPTLQRIPGREVFHDLLGLAKEKQWNVFLLGGKPGSGEKVIDQWTSRSVDQKIKSIGWQYDEGAQDIRNETQEEQGRVLQKIREQKPQLLFVAYGAPWQEKWVYENREELEKAGVKVAMVVGGSFEYEAGLVPVVHPLIAKLNLEWLQRLLFEPWRWKRQIQGSQFFLRFLLS